MNDPASATGQFRRFRPKAEPCDGVADLRKKLSAAGYSPVPVSGKRPPMDGWQNKIETNNDEIELWSKLYPDAESTGLLTKYTPALDIDILDEEAAVAVENLVRERFDERKGRS